MKRRLENADYEFGPGNDDAKKVMPLQWSSPALGLNSRIPASPNRTAPNKNPYIQIAKG
jgi:hypothetical protein